MIFARFGEGAMRGGGIGQVSVELGLLWGLVLLLVLLLAGGLVYFGFFEGNDLVESCDLEGVLGCADFAVFSECLVFDLENLAGRGLVVDNVSVRSESLAGECGAVVGQASQNLIGGEGVLGAGERGRFVLVEAGSDCSFEDPGGDQGNEYLINVSYSWLSNREMRGSIAGRLVANDPLSDGLGICGVPVHGVCGLERDVCWAGPVYQSFFNGTHFGWACDSGNNGTSPSCRLAKYREENTVLKPSAPIRPDGDEEDDESCSWSLELTGFSRSNVSRLGGVLSVGNVWDVFAVEDKAFVVGEGGFQVLDVSDLGNVSVSGSLLVEDGFVGGRSVFVLDERAFMVTLEGGIQVLNVSDPANVSVLGGLPYQQGVSSLPANDVLVQDELAFVVSAGDSNGTGSGVQILNVSDPNSIRVLGSVVDNSSLVLRGGRGIFALDDLVFVASEGDHGLQILNASNPANIRVLGSIVDGGTLALRSARDVFVTVGGLAFVVGEEGLQVLDVSDPANVSSLGSLSDSEELLFGEGRNVFVDESRGLAYVVGGEGVQFLNMADPHNVTALDSLDDDECLALEEISCIFVDVDRGVVLVCSWEEESIQVLIVESEVVDGTCSLSAKNSCFSGLPADFGESLDHWLWSCLGSEGGINVSCNLSKTEDAVCGSALDNCSVGDFSDVADNATHYLWSCNGLHGGADRSCELFKPVDGSCLGALNDCGSGSSIDVIDNVTHYLWHCSGLYGGRDQTCNLLKPVNGVCGSNLNTCDVGTFQNQSDTVNDYRWSCMGIAGGLTANCSQTMPRADGVCGSNLDACNSGVLADRNDTLNEYLWTCLGFSGGREDLCSLTKPRADGACGSSVNACDSGTFSDVDDSLSLFKWSCLGWSGGTSVACEVSKPRADGACGSSVNACDAGTFRNQPDTLLEHKWSCLGWSGGSTDTCGLSRPREDGDCGSSVNACDAGEYRSHSDTAANYRWYCDGIGGGITANCSKGKSAVNGQCDTTTVNGCTAGDWEDRTDTTSSYRWYCNGRNGGNRASCSKAKPTPPPPSQYTPTPPSQYTPPPPQAVDGECAKQSYPPLYDHILYSCKRGTVESRSQTVDRYLWSCRGLGGGATASCFNLKPAKCGTSLNNCIVGYFEDEPDTARSYMWKCMVDQGPRHGGGSICSKDRPRVDGKCGTTINECLAGEFEDRADTTTSYRWYCNGIGGGSGASCIRNDGECAKQSYPPLYDHILYSCKRGTVESRSQTVDRYLWSCRGLGGGATASCFNLKPAKCGTSLNNCIVGYFEDEPDTARSYMWKCMVDQGPRHGGGSICSKDK